MCPMALCSYCRLVTIVELRSSHIVHQPSLNSLKDSASSCNFCSLIWHRLETTCNKDDIRVQLQGRVANREEDTDTGIRLCGEFHDNTERGPEEGVTDSLIWISSGKNWIEGPQYNGLVNKVHSSLRLYTTPDNPAALYFPGREISTCPQEDDELKNRFVGWFSDCMKTHSLQSRAVEVSLPTRLIDLEPMDHGRPPLLAETAGRKGEYVALSYCWGKDQTFKTTKSNYHEFTTKGIELARLTLTLKDAVEVTRILGIRYIWIDAICIIQKEANDPRPATADFEKEGLKMAEYYGNAVVTIVAGSAADSRDGFFRIRRPQPSHQPVPLSYSRSTLSSFDGIKTGHVYAALPRSTEIGPLQTRAWTLQEELLSNRLLIFGLDQICYRCSAATIWEDGTVRRAKWTQNDPFDEKPRLLAIDSQIKNDEEARDRMLLEWYGVLRDYTRRNRGNALDKLTALAGVAQRAHELIGGRYLFGHWENDFLRGLLWRTGWWPGDAHPTVVLERPSTFRAPSWSWTSVEGSVLPQYMSERQEKSYLGEKNMCVEILSICEGIAHHFDHVRASAHTPESMVVRLCGTVRAVRAVTGQIIPSPKLPRRGKYNRCQGRFVNLVPQASSGEDIKIIGIALPDINISPKETEFFCLRLIRDEGLLLRRLQDDSYERLGVFLVANMDWFEAGEKEELRLA